MINIYFLSGRVIIGLVIIIIGSLMLLERLGYGIGVGDIIGLWPLIPLILGLNWLVLTFRSAGTIEGSKTHFSWGQLLTALLLICIGVLYLGRNTGLLDPVYAQQFWRFLLPALLILIGFMLLRGKTAAGISGGNRTAFMGGIKMGNTAWKLGSGNYFAFMGSIELDLTTAEIAEGETVLDLTAFMGGVDVKIPKDLPVVYEGTAILGGVSFLDHEDGGVIASRSVEHNINPDHDRRIYIKTLAIMGGIDIKEIEG